MNALAVCLLGLLTNPNPRPANLGQPTGPASLPSPDAAYTLAGDRSHSQLWLEGGAHQRTLVMGLTLQTATVLWSPDSRRFVVNDRPASGFEDGYLYTVAPLKRRLDLRKLVFAADPRAVTLASLSTHAYVHATGWLSPGSMEVKFNGRTDTMTDQERRRLNPDVDSTFPHFRCYDFRYRISLAGRVQKLSQRTVPVEQCGAMDIYE